MRRWGRAVGADVAAAVGRAIAWSGADNRTGVDAAVGAGGTGGLVHGRVHLTAAIVDVRDRVFTCPVVHSVVVARHSTYLSKLVLS